MRTGVAFDDVLAAAQAGAAWAFEVLYRDLSPVVTGYLRLHGAAEPDDLASETFLGVFTGLAGFSGDEDALRSWVFTIAHRRLIDDWRRRSRRPQLTDDAGDLTLLPGGDAEDDALMRVGTEDVHRMCAGLPDDQRSVLLLRVLADLTVEQVASVMGRSVGSVKALQRRGLRTLRERLEKLVRRNFRHPRTPGGPAGDDRGEMTTAADDSAVEDAFEAILAGRPVPEGAAGLAAFTEAVRASATRPGRPNAALAELLATGLLTDQSSPSVRTATSAGSAPERRRPRVRTRRRPAMIFSALIAKFLSAGAVAQAATGATVAVVAFTGVGAVGALPDPVQDTFATVVAEITPLEPPTCAEETTEEVVPEETVAEEVETTEEVPEDPREDAEAAAARPWRPRSGHGPSRDRPTASRSAPGSARARRSE